MNGTRPAAAGDPDRDDLSATLFRDLCGQRPNTVWTVIKYSDMEESP